MIKIKDLDDLNRTIKVVTQAVRVAKLKEGGKYRVMVKLYWPLEGGFHLDAEVLVSILAKEMHKMGLDMNQQAISCGLHQDQERAGEIEIIFEERLLR